MTDVVEIVQVAAPSLVALAAIGFASRQQTREFRHARALGDRAELRERLDESAQELRRAEGISGAARGLLLTHGAHFGEASGETLKELKEAVRDVELNHERLTIRLGRNHLVVEAHGTARGHLKSAGETLLLVASMPPATIESTDQLKESWEVLKRSLPELRNGQQAFVEEAVALVGTELGRQENRWQRYRRLRRLR